MNPRIRELMVELKKTVSTHRGAEVLAGYDEIEKFAELIVRECGEVAYKAYWNNPETVKGRHIEEQIREHFGVER
jgi:hypothetical protein